MPRIESTNKVRRPWLPERPAHTHATRKVDNSAIYNSRRWRNLRLQVLYNEPLCRHCAEQGLVMPATVVDHITPITQGGAIWDVSNLQPLCTTCHAQKSGRERHTNTQEEHSE